MTDIDANNYTGRRRLLVINPTVVASERTSHLHGLHLSGKGAAVFAEGLSGAVASGLGKVRYLN